MLRFRSRPWTSRRLLPIVGLVLAGAAVATWRLAPWTSRGAVRPDPSVFTIYLLGSSTALGYPYYPRADLGKMTRLFVGNSIDGLRVRVVNLAGPGKTARVVLRDVRDLAEQSPPPGRSLACLYIGNNEFTRFDRRHDLRQTPRTLFDQPVVSPDERALVEARYRVVLEQIVDTLQRAGIGVVASSAAVNLKDWDPNRSVLGDAAHADNVRALLEAGEREFAADRPAAARARFESALALEPSFALASKRAGDCCRALGRRAPARRHYQNAVDHDGNPLRETSRLDAVLREVCAQRSVPLLDAARALASASPDSLLGFDLLWDNCHPNLNGYSILARAFASVLDSLYEVTLHPMSAEELRTALGIDTVFERQVLNVEGQYCYVASTLTFDPKPRLATARRYLERADAMGSDADVACSLAVLAALEGDAPASLEQWRRAVSLDAKVAKGRMENRYVAQVMTRCGIADLAKAIR